MPSTWDFVRDDRYSPGRFLSMSSSLHPSARSRGTGRGGSGRRFGLRLGVAAGLLAAVAALGAFLDARYLRVPFLRGMRIDGEVVPAMQEPSGLRAFLTARAEALAARRVEFFVPGEKTPALVSTLGEMGLRVDVDETLDLAGRIGKNADLWSRVQSARDAWNGRIDVPLRLRVDREIAFRRLFALKEQVDTDAVSARLDLDKHATIPERSGRYIDQDAVVAQLEIAALKPPTSDSGRGADAIRLELPIATFAPRIGAAYLKNLDISTVLAEYETFFSRSGEQRRRGKNIDNAAQKLDGLVISPSELVSFNTAVGERSEANGFAKSWEIFKGEMVEGVGGGTCQVASTFHAAAFFGGFDVLERLPHSRPSAYIPMGLDSTVVYPGVDLKLRNPHPFPVVVHAKTEGGKLRIELLGKSRPVEVSFGRDLVATIPFQRKIIEDPSLSGKKVVIKQHGIKGFRIRRSRLLKYPDGTSKRENALDFYPPTVEIYRVPVGFDVALLPSLPGGEDTELGGNPGAAPAAARTPSATAVGPASACVDCTTPSDGIEFVESPGAHAPTAAQRDPARSVWLKR